MITRKNSNTSNTKRVALFSTLVAVTTGLQVAPKPWGFGLEFTSFLTFSTGVVFGSLFGASLGAFVMFVNGFLSPWGLAGLNMPFQMLGMSIIGAVGGFYKMENNGKARFYGESAVLGAFLTFIYYTFLLNLGYALQRSLFSPLSLLEAFVVVQVEGAAFTALYVISNAVLFGAGVVPLVSAMKKILGR